MRFVFQAIRMRTSPSMLITATASIRPSLIDGIDACLIAVGAIFFTEATHLRFQKTAWSNRSLLSMLKQNSTAMSRSARRPMVNLSARRHGGPEDGVRLIGGQAHVNHIGGKSARTLDENGVLGLPLPAPFRSGYFPETPRPLPHAKFNPRTRTHALTGTCRGRGVGRRRGLSLYAAGGTAWFFDLDI